MDPKNAWLRGKLAVETKNYKRLTKFKQRKFTDSLFTELESIHSKDSKAYMELVKSLRDNKHDRPETSDLKEIGPDLWFQHFSGLLGKKSR